MTARFDPDEKIQKIAEAYALDAVDFAAEQHRIVLDWSDGSVRDVEIILDALYKSKPKSVSTELIMQFAKMFGSYIGETYRRSRNPAAKWGMADWDGSRFVAISSGGMDEAFWPWGRVKERLENGAEDNVWHYYEFALPK